VDYNSWEAGNSLNNFGAIIDRFLPPYSPDLNPIEEAFSQVKHYLRQNDLVLQSARDSTPLIWDAFGQITPSDCLVYMHHSG
jgi:transposase